MLPLDVVEAARRGRTYEGPLADYLASGGDPDDVDEEGKPLLHIGVAVYTGTRTVFKTVRAVLAAGPRNVDIRWEGLTPLFGELPTDVFRHVLRFWRSGREEGISWK